MFLLIQSGVGDARSRNVLEAIHEQHADDATTYHNSPAASTKTSSKSKNKRETN